MEGRERLDLEPNCSLTALDLGSKPSEITSEIADGSKTRKQSEIYSSSNLSRAADNGELASVKISPEIDVKQAIPLAISLSGGILAPNAVIGPEVATSRSVLAEASIPDNMLPHKLISPQEGPCVEPASSTAAVSMDALALNNKSRLEDISAMQPAASASAQRRELTSTMSLASDGCHILQLASAATATPNVTSETESSLLASDQRTENPLKKEKIRKRPRQLLQDARTRDLNKSSEKQPVIRWKDVWVAQLIHIRGRMHSTFTSPQRQRVDLWQIVKHEMTTSCHGFDKDSEACRKKWIRVYKEYKDDLHLSSDEKTQKCRFYDLVDFYMGDRANSFRNMTIRPPDFIPTCPNIMHAAIGPTVPPPLPPSSGGDAKAMDSGAMVLQASSDTCLSKQTSVSDTSLSKQTSISISKKPPLAKKARFIEKPLELEQPTPLLDAPVAAAATSKKPQMKSSVQTMLSELVNIGKEMLQTTREFEKEKLAVLHSIKDTLGKIAKKI